ncbi:DUF4097 family beta strand repeat-containing protein [Marivirga atlantica]|jgi:hypothetical protein|uniref:Adhesin domain-containing protein n=1 Tax=Marivirga atlantica TaxID=1548457 RepID=A0A937A8I1_9BACT|nr:hypothetical protein [Marivirga atlantica]MBL0765550.1 hypothetical protein [Marivirga atlantica]
MKHRYKMIYVIGLLFITSWSVAQEQTKELFNKTYKVSSNASLELDNSFGNITVSLWNKQEFEVIVELKLDGFNAKETEKFLSKVSIDGEGSSSAVKVSTDWDDNISTNGKRSFELNYMVKIPNGHPLDIENSFGNLSLPDYSGNVKLDVEYGNLNAGKLKSGDIELSFGSGTIEELASGKLEVKYADELDINYLGTVEFETGFSKVTIQKADDIELEGKYGELEIDEINSLSGSSSFSSLEIGTLKKKLDVEVKYVSGKLRVDHIASTFDEVTIESKFSQLDLNFDAGSSFNFHTEHKFGKLRIDKSNFKLTMSDEEDFSAEYKGYVGSSSGTAKVYVSTSYGDADLDIN